MFINKQCSRTWASSIQIPDVHGKNPTILASFYLRADIWKDGGDGRPNIIRQQHTTLRGCVNLSMKITWGHNALTLSKKSIKPSNWQRTNRTIDGTFINGKHHSGPNGSGSGSKRWSNTGLWSDLSSTLCNQSVLLVSSLSNISSYLELPYKSSSLIVSLVPMFSLSGESLELPQYEWAPPESPEKWPLTLPFSVQVSCSPFRMCWPGSDIRAGRPFAAEDRMLWGNRDVPRMPPKFCRISCHK